MGSLDITKPEIRVEHQNLSPGGPIRVCLVQVLVLNLAFGRSRSLISNYNIIIATKLNELIRLIRSLSSVVTIM